MWKKIIPAFLLVVLLISCSDSEAEKEQDELDELKETRDNAVGDINDNIEYIFATESLTDVWHIEDSVLYGEEADEDRLFRFTDEYIMDEETFRSFNEYEEGLAMKTSTMITKFLKGKYDDDKDKFKEDVEDYYDVLENGDEFFMN